MDDEERYWKKRPGLTRFARVPHHKKPAASLRDKRGTRGGGKETCPLKKGEDEGKKGSSGAWRDALSGLRIHAAAGNIDKKEGKKEERRRRASPPWRGARRPTSLPLHPEMISHRCHGEGEMDKEQKEKDLPVSVESLRVSRGPSRHLASCQANLLVLFGGGKS